MMGTFVNIQVLATPDSKEKVKKAINSAFDEIDKLETKASRFLEESDPAKIEKLKPDEVLIVSPWSWKCFQIADEVTKKTKGLYDITSGPLVDLWGFGRNKIWTIPDPEKIDSVLKIVGWEKICMLDSMHAVSVSVTGVQIDLSSVAKGLAADIAVEKIKEHGLSNILVNAGGEIRTSSSGEKVWRVGIQIPEENLLTQNYLEDRVVKIKNSAVATSGSYLNYFKNGANKYSHIINPITGRPFQTETVSVTVLAKSCAAADAWATGLFTLPAEEAIALANQTPEIDCMIIERPLPDKDKFRFHFTELFSSIE